MSVIADVRAREILDSRGNPTVEVDVVLLDGRHDWLTSPDAGTLFDATPTQPSVVNRIKAASDSGKYDAVITQAGIEPGFLAARMVSKIPVAYPVHSAVHMASMLGEKFCVLTTTDAQAMTVRRNVQAYGLNHKLTSVRYVSRSSTFTMALVRKYPKADRLKSPEVMEFANSIVDQFVHAIEDEGADTVIIGSPHQQCFLDEVRAGLDARGYQEINLMGAFACAVEMARAMVNMGIKQAARAYPSDKLKAKPAFR